MDPRVKRILDEITANLPRELSDNLMMDDPNDVAYDAINDELLKSKHIDEKAKKAIAAAGKTQKKEPIVNERVARLIEEYYDREIKSCIKKGILPAPVADQFIRDRARKMQESKNKGKV